jgi:hypothetical protein
LGHAFVTRLLREANGYCDGVEPDGAREYNDGDDLYPTNKEDLEKAVAKL